MWKYYKNWHFQKQLYRKNTRKTASQIFEKIFFGGSKMTF